MREKDFPFALNCLRGKQCLTQAQLAEELQVNVRTIKLWETGKVFPRRSVRIRIAQKFDLPLTEFLLDSEFPGGSDTSNEDDRKGNMEVLFKDLSDLVSEANVPNEIKKSLSQAISDTMGAHL